MASKHLHRYRRKSKSKIYFCTKDACFHRMEAEFLIGKHAECPECGGEYALTTEALRRVIPHCLSCTKGTRNLLVGDAMSALNALFKEKEDARKEEERVGGFDPFATGDVESV